MIPIGITGTREDPVFAATVVHKSFKKEMRREVVTKPTAKKTSPWQAQEFLRALPCCLERPKCHPQEPRLQRCSSHRQRRTPLGESDPTQRPESDLKRRLEIYCGNSFSAARNLRTTRSWPSTTMVSNSGGATACPTMATRVALISSPAFTPPSSATFREAWSHAS